MNIGERIRKLRRNKELTQQQLADLCCLSKNSIIRYEKGKSYPTEANLFKLSRVLDTQIEYLKCESNIHHKNYKSFDGLSNNAISTLEKMRDSDSIEEKHAMDMINILLDINNYNDVVHYFNNIFLFMYAENQDEVVDLKIEITKEDIMNALLLKNNDYLKKFKNR